MRAEKGCRYSSDYKHLESTSSFLSFKNNIDLKPIVEIPESIVEQSAKYIINLETELKKIIKKNQGNLKFEIEDTSSNQINKKDNMIDETKDK